MPRGVPAQLTGQRFGRWTVESRTQDNKPGRVQWNCRCDCGHRAQVSTGNLTGGKSQGCRSCGNSRENSVRWKNEGEA